MTIDVERLRAVDPVAFIGADVPLKRLGHEYHGPCPFCGKGHHRFVVWPDEWWWWCRRCERSGDLIAYVQQRGGLDFRGACDVLARFAGINLPEIATSAAVSAQSARGGRPRDSMPPRTRTPVPSPEWRACALEVVQRCERALWTPTRVTNVRGGHS